MQEEIKAIQEEYFPSKRTPEENKTLCDKYPFLKWYGDPLYMGYSEDHELDYHYTWEDEIPIGWRKAFCPKMWDELLKILTKANYLNEFRFTQIKEKWGELRIYFYGIGEASKKTWDKINAWADKYKELSKQICIECGAPTKYMTIWPRVSFVCETCARNPDYTCIAIENIEEYYRTPRDQKEKFYAKFEE